jgi:hypothetical protein
MLRFISNALPGSTDDEDLEQYRKQQLGQATDEPAKTQQAHADTDNRKFESDSRKSNYFRCRQHYVSVSKYKV